MSRYLVKVTQTEGQTRVTIPKTIAEKTGLDKARVVEIWSTEEHIIHIMEYHGKTKEDRSI